LKRDGSKKFFCVQKSCQLRIKDDGRLETDFRNTKTKEIRKKKKQVIQRNLSKNSFLDGKTLKKEKKENSFLIIR